MLDTLPRARPGRGLLLESAVHQRTSLHVLVLLMLREQPDESVLLCHGESAVQENIHANSEGRSAHQLNDVVSPSWAIACRTEEPVN